MLLDPRITYAPFEYEWVFQAFELQTSAHWTWAEINMASDINDWKTRLTESEKNVVAGILKGFTQAELCIGEYWANKIPKWFPKSEFQLLGSCFANMEAIHAVSYAYLNQSLGLEDFDAFLAEPSAKAKIDRLMEVVGNSKEEIARSLAIYSAFNEGVNLFSSFAVLLNFSRFSKLRGVGAIIAFSIKDESLHSSVGVQIARTLIEEYPEIWTDEFKKDLYDAARLTVHLEDAFIDKVFELGPIEGLIPEDLKAFIRFRCNTKLTDLGLKKNWKNISKESLDRMAWFDVMSSGVGHADFFVQRPDDYSKNVIDFSTIWDS